MTKNPVTVDLGGSLSDVRKIMHEGVVRHVPVISGHKLVGMVSSHDIERFTQVNRNRSGKLDTSFNEALTLGDVMKVGLNVLQQNDSIKEAAEILSLGNYHALPVLDDETLVGIVTTTDIIKYLLKHYMKDEL
ncbi:MAG: CBS domain-containing protein [Saprospiraceae bacterium]|nr:CBS domain-containing protein [Saprospiraceae bacterium]